MHELALSESIVRTAIEAAGAQRSHITEIGVRVGALSAVNLSSLEFCLRLALDQREMGHTEVKTTWVPAQAQCECGARYQADDLFSGCPQCGGFLRRVLDGMDVTVEYVEVEDESD